MTSAAVAPLRLSSAADLLEAVPYLLGFHPTDSLVGVALRGARRRVVFTMRLDLPLAGAPAGGEIDLAEVSDGVAAYLAHAKADHAVLVTYGNGAAPGDALPHTELMAAITGALADRQIEVMEALHVGAGRWWSHLCGNHACCPPEGTPLAAPSSSPVAAAATYAGMVALPSRQALEDSLEPVGSLAAEGMQQALDRAAADVATRCSDRSLVASVRTESLAVITAAVDSGAALSEAEVARLTVGLHDVVVRDACCEWAATDRSDAARGLWTTLARRSVGSWSSAPLFLVGWFAYLAGDATLAAIAVDRCLRADPTYSFGLLLRAALQGAVDPALVRADLAAADRRS